MLVLYADMWGENVSHCGQALHQSHAQLKALQDLQEHMKKLTQLKQLQEKLIELENVKEVHRMWPVPKIHQPKILPRALQESPMSSTYAHLAFQVGVFGS